MTKNGAAVGRGGSETRANILRVALQLFAERGYEATSTRDIGEVLGITKPALYYHFRSKEDIVVSLIAIRRKQLEDFVIWLKQQRRGPELLEVAAIKWIESSTPESMQLMRLMHANPVVLQRIVASGQDVRSGFDEVIEQFAEQWPAPLDQLLVRMAFDTVTTAMLCAGAMHLETSAVLCAAKRATRAISRSLQKEC